MKSVFHLNILGWSSGFRAIDVLPRAHCDETEFSRSFILNMAWKFHPVPYSCRKCLLKLFSMKAIVSVFNNMKII